MSRALRSAACLLTFAVMAACSNVSQLTSKKPQEDADFNSRLAAEYLAYAQSESEQGQKQDAEYYASKGLKAEKGEAVAPEELPRDLSAKRAKTLANARVRMLKSMTPTAKTAAPQVAARTQLLFDCWLDQQQEVESNEIISCGEEFNISVSDLEKAAKGKKTTVVE